MESSNPFHLGVDWAKQAHDADLTRADGTRLAHGRFPHRGEGMAQLQDWLQEHTGGGEIAAVIEVPHGAVVEALQAMGVAAYAVNPKPLFHDRESNAMSGAKDDRRDARRLSSIPRIAPEILRPAAIASAPLRALRRATQLAGAMGGRPHGADHPIAGHPTGVLPRTGESGEGCARGVVPRSLRGGTVSGSGS